MKLSSRKGAIELSVSTIVVVVLAMSMLILGLVLVKNIFGGITYNVKTVDESVKAKINELFNEREERVVIYLPDNRAEVKQGKNFGVAFGVWNNVEGENQDGVFRYSIKASEVEKDCKLTLQQADNYLKIGAKSGVDWKIPPGQKEFGMVEIVPSSTAPLCSIRYNIEVTKDGQAFDTAFFQIKIK